jgi:diaminopimelate epimerase
VTARSLEFTKMEGAGNDYVYVDALRDPFPEAAGPAVARLVADRHFGIGSDGLIVLAPSRRAEVRMWMWNADGSRSSMCGNGLRCLAKLAHDHGHLRRLELTVETDVALHPVRLLQAGDGTITGARVEIGAVEVAARPESLEVDGRRWSYLRCDVGNPHAVTFVDEDPEQLPLERVGPAFQRAFAGGVNVELVQVLGPARLAQRTWERGSGETLACGSGAVAAAAAALATGRVRGPRVQVRLRGGELVITQEGRALAMEGPARTVFTGRIELPELE